MLGDASSLSHAIATLPRARGVLKRLIHPPFSIADSSTKPWPVVFSVAVYLKRRCLVIHNTLGKMMFWRVSCFVLWNALCIPRAFSHKIHQVYALDEQFTNARKARGRRSFHGHYEISSDDLIEGAGLSPAGSSDLEGQWVKIETNAALFGSQTDDEDDAPQGYPHCWGYIVHRNCWLVLEANCALYGTEVDAQALFDVCRSLPYRGHLLTWGHDFLHPWDQSDDSSLFSGELRRFTPYYFFNISEENSYDPLGQKECVGNTTLTRPSVPPQTWFIPRHPDAFRRLPVEMLCHIICLLPSRDVVHLRQASPTFASVPLTDEFWSSRFWPGGEFEWVIDAHQNRKARRGKWHSLFEEVKNTRDSSRWGGQNARRIWKLASMVRGYMQQRSGHSLCNGLYIPTYFEPSLGVPHSSPLSTDTWVTAACDIRPKERHFDGGARALYTRRITLPPSFQSMSISWLKIAGKSYISGVQILQADGQTIKLGYVNQRQTTVVHWNEEDWQGTSIHGFHVALEPTGIRGLSVVSSSGALSDWVGDTKWPPVRILTLPALSREENPRIRAIHAEFDVSSLMILPKRLRHRLSRHSNWFHCQSQTTRSSLNDSNTWRKISGAPSISTKSSRISDHGGNSNTRTFSKTSYRIHGLFMEVMRGST